METARISPFGEPIEADNPQIPLPRFSPTPVNPRVAAITSVTTGNQAVTAFSGPVSGFLLMAGTAAITYSLTGTAGSSVGGGTFALAAGQWLLFDTQLASGVSLSVNATASATGFGCIVW